jgi:hypothetical protein
MVGKKRVDLGEHFAGWSVLNWSVVELPGSKANRWRLQTWGEKT